MNGRDLDVVLVDTTPGGWAGSMSRYGRHVAGGLARFAPTVRIRTLRLGLPHSLLRRIPPRLATWAHHGWLLSVGTRRVTRCGAGLVHVLDGSYAYVAGGVAGGRLVTTCHDLIPLLQMRGHLPGHPGGAARRIVQASLDVVRRAACVVADSGRTRGDLIEQGGVAGTRITVVHQAIDPVFTPSPSNVAARGKDSERFLLHVGGDSPYKNRLRVVDVFESVHRRADLNLVLAGGALDGALARHLAGRSCQARVRVRRHPTDEALRDLYRGAELLLFPSRYEGFGWPVVEAMACGCPVVCSNAASLPEVAGDAALMAAPDDTEALAGLCLSILESREVKESCRRKGYDNASRFTLERMAAALHELYARVGGGGG